MSNQQHSWVLYTLHDRKLELNSFKHSYIFISMINLYQHWLFMLKYTWMVCMTIFSLLTILWGDDWYVYNILILIKFILDIKQVVCQLIFFFSVHTDAEFAEAEIQLLKNGHRKRKVGQKDLLIHYFDSIIQFCLWCCGGLWPQY